MDEGVAENSQQTTTHQQGQWAYTGAKPTYDGNEIGTQDQASLDMPSDAVEWVAPEFIEHKKTALWFIGFALGIFVATVAAYLFTSGDLVASVAIAVAGGAALIFAVQKPKEVQYKVDGRGVYVGDRNFHYSQFKSFSVVEEGVVDSIWLKPIKRFAPMVVMYFDPKDEAALVSYLAAYLPHEDRKLDLIDQLSQKLRF